MLKLFKIKKQEKAGAPYRMVLSWMHGDADGYTESTEEYTSEEALLKGYQEVRLIDQYMEPQRYEYNKNFRPLAEALGITADEASSYYYDLYPRNMSYSDRRAVMNGITLYARIDGVEYEIEPIQEQG